MAISLAISRSEKNSFCFGTDDLIRQNPQIFYKKTVNSQKLDLIMKKTWISIALY